MASLPLERCFWLAPNVVWMAHTEMAARCATEALSTTCAVYKRIMRDQLLSGGHSSVVRVLAAQARGPGSIPGNYWFFS